MMTKALFFRFLRISLFVLLSVILLSCFALSAFAAKPLAAKEATKDGLTAEFLVEADATDSELYRLSLRLTQSGTLVSDIRPTLVLPEALELVSGDAGEGITLSDGETKYIEYTFRLAKEDAETTDTPTTGSPIVTTDTPETDPADTAGGCASTIGSAYLLVACLALAALLMLRKGKVRKIALLLAVVLLASPMLFPLSASAASSERAFALTGKVKIGEESYPIEVKLCYQYTFEEIEKDQALGMDQFEITYYWGPQGASMYDEAMIKAIKECGFTSIPLENNSVEGNKLALQLLRQYGMTCSALMDYRITALAGYDRTVSPDTPQEEVDRVVQEVIAEYEEYRDVICGWWVQDEPCAARFEILGKIVSAFRRFDPERSTAINLFPTYASDKQLGTNGYQEYLDRFVAEVDPTYISYDHYHFLLDRARADFFQNLELVRAKGFESGLAPMQIILLTKHMSYADVTYDQIEFEVNMSLLYGMKRISYFTFFLSPDLLADGWSNACMDVNGQIYPHYYDVQNINQWLLPLGNELFGKTSTAVFHMTSGSLDKGCIKYEGYGALGEVNGKNFAVGFFDDESFMIANKIYYEGDYGNNVLEFIDVRSGLEYFDTTTSTWVDVESGGLATRNEDGNYVITFVSSQGILFRVAE